MKKIVFSILAMTMILLVSCSLDVFVDKLSIKISQTEVRNGDTIKMALETGESNVRFNVVYYWEDDEIGKSSTPPYMIEYKVENKKKGPAIIRAIASYSKKSYGQQTSGQSSAFTVMEVVE